MFGQNDNQQTSQVPDEALSASLPDPISGPVTPSVTAADDAFSQPPVSPVPLPDAVATPSAPDVSSNDTGTLPSTDELLTMKQDALQQLSPLVDQLDQSPEDKFRTTMMMIQAADDQTLLKNAYETAKKITDEKARAQALLDVVNEINYFTQQHHSN